MPWGVTGFDGLSSLSWGVRHPKRRAGLHKRAACMQMVKCAAGPQSVDAGTMQSQTPTSVATCSIGTWWSQQLLSSRYVRQPATLTNVMPVASRNRRVKVRRTCALRRPAHPVTAARANCVPTPERRGKCRPLGSEGTGCSMYCACPPWRCGGVTSSLATRLATSAP